MFGQLLRTHGEHLFWSKPVPDGAPTMAQTFRNAGYRTFAVGKLHVTPQRDRIGCDDVILNVEGRYQTITAND